MKIEAKMPLLFNAAYALSSMGIKGVRLNYIYGKHFYHPVNSDLLIVDQQNTPRFIANLSVTANSRGQVLSLHKLKRWEQLPLFGELVKRKADHTTEHIGDLALENSLPALSPVALESLRSFSNSMYTFGVHEAKYFKEIYKNIFPAPQAATAGFARLAWAWAAEAPLEERTYIFPPLTEYIYADPPYLQQFDVFALAGRKRERAETLLLEHALRRLPPHGGPFLFG